MARHASPRRHRYATSAVDDTGVTDRRAGLGARATVRLLCRADGAVAAGGDWHAAAARTCAAPIDRVALGLAVSCRVASFGAAVVLPWPGGLASEAWEVARGCACGF